MAKDDPPITVPEFGSMLWYEGSPGALLVLVIVGGVGSLMTLGGITSLHDKNVLIPIGLLVFGVFFLAFTIFIVSAPSESTWFYEHGVIRQRGKKVRTVAYKDVREVAYWVTTVNTSYGLQICVDIFVRPRDGSPDLRLGKSFSPNKKPKPGQRSEQDARKLGDTLVHSVAKEMLTELQQGHAVGWTKEFSLEPGGVRLCGDGRLVTWNQIDPAGVIETNGYIEVRTRDVQRPVLRMANKEMNGRPGMYVVQARLRQGK